MRLSFLLRHLSSKIILLLVENMLKMWYHICKGSDIMKIGNIELKHGLMLAPLAGVSDRTFRTLCRECGAEYTVKGKMSATGFMLRIMPVQLT